ncbi:MAG: hypothetical protein LUM44_11265 [Pyrinomonadaceae bacterium]|nr:hypothetical protein [Pyrinomonadaceae bacterium]
METGKVRLSNEVDVNFSRQKTTRKNGKMLSNDKTNFNFSFRLLIGIALIFSVALLTYILGDSRHETNKSQATPAENAKNVTFDSSSHNNYSPTITDNSTNYIYPSNSVVSIDKSMNKISPNPDNTARPEPRQTETGVTPPLVRQSSPSQKPKNRIPSNSAPIFKQEPFKQSAPQNQTKVIDFTLDEYLIKMNDLALRGRKAADIEQSLSDCISRQNKWYRQTLPLLKDFQHYLQTNYEPNYFLVRDSGIEQVTTDKVLNAEQCRELFSIQGSVLISLSKTIRLNLSDNLPNS